MVKKLFALASVTALTGLVSAVSAAGCSSTEVVNQPVDSGGVDAAKAKTDAKPPIEDEDAGDDTPPSCRSKDVVDATKIPYKKAGIFPGACSTADITALNAYVDAAGKNPLKISEWSAKVSASCAKCVWSDGAGSTWTPILVKSDKIDAFNKGGCIEAVSGDEACGRAYHQASECINTACLPTAQGGQGTCKTQAEFDECRQDIQGLFTEGGPCEASYAKMDKDCGGNLEAYENACANTKYVFDASIQKMCVGNGGDAGDGG